MKSWKHYSYKALGLIQSALTATRRQSLRFLLSRRLLCGPDRWRISSCRLSNESVQKQQLNLAPGPSWGEDEITPRWTEHRCLSKWAFCLNIATHSLHANGFSPVWTLKWVFKFQLIPNVFPQYWQRYSLTGTCLEDCCAEGVELLRPSCNGGGLWPPSTWVWHRDHAHAASATPRADAPWW